MTRRADLRKLADQRRVAVVIVVVVMVTPRLIISLGWRVEPVDIHTHIGRNRLLHLLFTVRSGMFRAVK